MATAAAAGNGRMLIIQGRKKQTPDRCAPFKYGSLNNNCGTRPHDQPPPETFSDELRQASLFSSSSVAVRRWDTCFSQQHMELKWSVCVCACVYVIKLIESTRVWDSVQYVSDQEWQGFHGLMFVCL